MGGSLSSVQSGRVGTGCGFAAILLWSSSVALVRSLSEAVGSLTAAALVYGVSGILAAGRCLLVPGAWGRAWRLPRKYLLGCGGLFVLYMPLFYLAVGTAGSRQQVLEVGLLNYLWPSLTILFSLVLLGRRATWLLLPGTGLALAGIILVLTQGAEVSWRSFAQHVAGSPAAYGMGAAAGVSWALYSALTRRWADGERGGGVDLFLPAAGLILIALSFCWGAWPAWSSRAIVEAGLLGIITYAAYGLWDAAMRRGNVALVAAGSYLTPLLSTLISSVYLGVAPTAGLWVGCGLLVAGSLLSWLSVAEPPGRNSLTPPAGRD
jgi:drug/metabolite transporter (DMT)-like permease